MIAAAIFLGFAVLAAWTGRRPEARRARAFVAYAVSVSLAAGLLQRELWPFASWPLIVSPPADDMALQRLYVVDAEGGEHAPDGRAFEPLGHNDLLSWLWVHFPHLDAADRDATFEDLLARARASRERVRNGGSSGVNARRLGPLTVPDTLIVRRRWSRPEDVPPKELVALRLYQDRWSLVGRWRYGSRGSRTLVYEYRQP